MPDPVMDSEKNACPMAMTQVSVFNRYSHLGINKNRYPSKAPSRKNTRTAKTTNNPKNAGISTLLIFSMPFVAPAIKRPQAMRTTAPWQGILPNDEDISPKNSPVSLTNSSPVRLAPRVFNTHPNMTEYPMAMPREPIRGIHPRT